MSDLKAPLGRSRLANEIVLPFINRTSEIMDTEPTLDISEIKEVLNGALRTQLLSSGSIENILIWLSEPRYKPYVAEVFDHIRQESWAELEAAFWTTVPFGTAGRRGRMYPIGSNAINEATIGETVQGLADYLQQRHHGKSLRCAIAYDTRHRSRDFAELCAEVMTANEIRTFFLDGHRSTPALASTVQLKSCHCGIMVSASHNPPSDNAVKIFWDNGGQIRPPHDQGVLRCAQQVQQVARLPFQSGVAAGTIEFCQDAVDEYYQRAVLKLGYTDNRAADFEILFSPLHGVAATSILPVLETAGFPTELYADHAEPNGDFPNVPANIANPENPAVFDGMIAAANDSDFELILASDPDADRIGCAARLTPDGPWATLNGNQIAVLICEYLLAEMQSRNELSRDHFVVKTLVTTDMLKRVADAFAVRCFGEVLTGFKWIGKVIDEVGPEQFVFGAEEAHGYLAGTHIRDKDGAAAAILLAEAAVRARRNGSTLHQWLDRCYCQYGCHVERTRTQMHPGAEGMAEMNDTMDRLRANPPEAIAGLSINRRLDYLRQQETIEGRTGPLVGPQGNVLVFNTNVEGNYMAVRPSGTEPKIKYYFFTYAPPQEIDSLEATKHQLNQRIDAMATDLFAAIRAY